MIGARGAILFPPEDRAAGAPGRGLEEARRSGRASDERYPLRKNGARFFSSGVTRRLGAGGIGFAKVARDLTAQRESAEALEARVRARTEEIEADLQQHASAKASVTNLLHRILIAQEDERRRIARDLHDQLGQQLTVLRLALERHRADAADGNSRHIDEALALTRQIGRDVDFLAWELRPAALDELGLVAALPRFLNDWSAHVGVPAEFHLRGFETGRLAPEAELAFYRIAQEALNNVAKHAQATRVDVVLAADAGEVVLIVEDDGAGFDVPDGGAATGGLGLAGMAERASLVGATLQVESAVAKGTSVFVRCRRHHPCTAAAT